MEWLRGAGPAVASGAPAHAGGGPACPRWPPISTCSPSSPLTPPDNAIADDSSTRDAVTEITADWTPGLGGTVVTIDLEDDPLVGVLAVEALLRLLEWLHHEGTAPARRLSRSPRTDRRMTHTTDTKAERVPLPSPCKPVVAAHRA